MRAISLLKFIYQMVRDVSFFVCCTYFIFSSSLPYAELKKKTSLAQKKNGKIIILEWKPQTVLLRARAARPLYNSVTYIGSVYIGCYTFGVRIRILKFHI